jgi:hypothetical protein
MSPTDAEVMEHLRAKDQMLFGLSDILDAKAGIALVVITFLASQSSDLLTTDSPLPPVLWFFQMVSIGCLAAAGIAAVGSLWPRDHAVEKSEELEKWAGDLREYYKDDANPEVAVENAFRKGLVERLKERIATNAEIDATKADLLNRAYKLAGISLGLNLLTLVSMAVLSVSPS